MRTIVEVGYKKILLAEGADVSGLLAALNGAEIVTVSGGYRGEPLSYILDDEDINIRLVGNIRPAPIKPEDPSKQ